MEILWWDTFIQYGPYGSQEIRCQLCEFTTNIKRNLERHMQSTHLRKNDKKCNLCDYKTYVGYQLTRHMKSNHGGGDVTKHKRRKLSTDAYKYSCSNCDYKSSNGGHLKRHNGEKHEEPSLTRFHVNFAITKLPDMLH